ncbi:MAG: WD40 repeat domain-containing protein [Anaerolineales bacterium]
MKRYSYALLVAVVVLACSAPGTLVDETSPPPTATGSVGPPTPTPSSVPPTAVPPSPTPLSPVITADTVGHLTVGLTFGEGAISSLAFSPDGTVLAVAEVDIIPAIGTIQLYEAATGLPLRRLEGHTSGAAGLAFSPDGRYLASVHSRDRTARIWDWAAGTTVKVIEFPNEVVAVAFSPDSRTLAVGGVDELPGKLLQDAAIWTYAVDSWLPQLKLAEYWNIPDLAYSPDGSLIVGGGISRNARVWRSSDGAQLFILYHPAQVARMAVSADGSTAATTLCEASEDGQCTRGAVWLWSLTTGRHIKTLSGFSAGVGDVAYTTDGSVLFATSRDGTLFAYSTLDYRILLNTTAPAGPVGLALSANGRFLATSGWLGPPAAPTSGRIHIWSVGE